MKVRDVKTLLVIAFCVPEITFCAFERLDQGGKSVAMGGALMASPDDGWAAFSNPAGLASIGGRTLALFHVPSLFGIPGLGRSSFAFVQPAPFGGWGLSGTRCGCAQYREIELSVACGGRVAARLDLGVSLKYCRLAIEGYGSARAFGVALGALVGITQDLRWGFTADNVNSPVMGKVREKLPQTFTSGVSYTPVPEVEIVAAVAKDVRFPVETHFGVQYTLLGCIALRGGTVAEPAAYSMGLGLRLLPLDIDYAGASNPELGMTHHFSLSLHF